MSAKPYLVIRAFVDPVVQDEFERWYRETHLPHVLEIPGVIAAFRCRPLRQGVNFTALYQLDDDSSVQQVFSSQEAQQARQDWERWVSHVRDLSVEVYSQLSPLPPYHHWN